MKLDEHGECVATVRQAMSSTALVDPPEWVRERARRLYRTPLRGTMTLIERVRAALVFDSRKPGLTSTGVRSLGVAEGALEGPWQLLYRGGDVDVDLLVRPNQDGHTTNVRGQALSHAGDAVGTGIVEALPASDARPLHAATPHSARTELEPTGEFALPDLERGRYDVLLRFGSREIELSGVEL
jgi:hypothetical protein